MPITQKRFVPFLGLLLAFTLIAVTSSVAMADQAQQPSSQQPSAQQPPAQQPPSTQKPSTPPSTPSQAQQKEQTARGELQSVDTTSKMLTIKPTVGAEEKFQYNDSTKVTGGKGGVAGLATMSGREVIVHYNMQAGNRVATEIEVQPEKK